MVGEAFLKTNKKGNLISKGSYSENTSSPRGVGRPAKKLYHTMDTTGTRKAEDFDTHSNTTSLKYNLQGLGCMLCYHIYDLQGKAKRQHKNTMRAAAIVSVGKRGSLKKCLAPGLRQEKTSKAGVSYSTK